MQISSRFTIAIHILGYIETMHPAHKVTSDILAGSIGVNPVVVRRILSQLRNAGLIQVARGTGGTSLAKPAAEISLYEVFESVDLIEDNELFHFHEPNPECPVGRNIHGALDRRLHHVQTTMERELKKYTVADVIRDLNRQMAREK